MVRHRAALVAVVALLVLVAGGCQPDVLPVGARPTAGGEVEGFYRSCPQVPLRLTLSEAVAGAGVDGPGAGTTPAPSWTTAWEGTVDGDTTSALIPVVLRPDRAYRLGVAPANADDRLAMDSEPLVFVASDLDPAEVVSSRPPGGPPVSPDAFAAATAATCAGPAGIVRPVAIGIGAVACVLLLPVLGIIVLAARAARRRPARSPSPTIDPAAPGGR